MHSRLFRIAMLARASIALLACALAMPLRAAPEGSVASVEAIVPPGTALPDAARFVRAGRPVAASLIGHGGLQAGDQIFLRGSQVALAIRVLATGELKLVKHYPDSPAADPDYVIPRQGLPGAPPGLFDLLATLLRNSRANTPMARIGADRDVAVAAYARACPNPRSSNEPVRFRIPALAAYDAQIAAGHRRLVVAWRGGVAPFDVQLRDAHDRPLAEVAEVKGDCTATLPEAEIVAGLSYSLVVTDGNGARAVAMSIAAVTDLPPVPHEIVDAGFSTSVASLYYATWLTTQNDGAWTWEAVQRVATIGCGADAARDWLKGYAVAPPCP